MGGNRRWRTPRRAGIPRSSTREELGAAATHGHRAMGREEYATHEAHGGAGTSGGHGQHGGDAGHSEDMFKRPFWVSLVLTIPVLVYAELLQEALGYAASCLIPACLTASGRRDTGLIMTV